MVSSGPGNRALRDGWRQRMAELQQRRGIKVVFLVANTTSSGDQARLESEHVEAGDIAQCGVEVSNLVYQIHLSYIGISWHKAHAVTCRVLCIYIRKCRIICVLL